MQTINEGINTLQNWIKDSDNIVFFGGAGVSTESGIPDFRSTDGLYHQKYDYPPETILSHSFFITKIRVKINKPLKIKGLSTLFGVISSVLLLIYYV